MARLTLSCVVILFCASLFPCAVLPSVSPTTTPVTIPDTASPGSLLIRELPLPPHDNDYSAGQSAREKRAKLSDPLFPEPDKVADFVNDTIVNEAVRQIIWKGEIGGLQNLYKPTRSIIPTMFTLLNETAGVVRELIMLADAVGTISVETRAMWREMRTGYASWAKEMRTANNYNNSNNKSTTVASIADVPEDLEHLPGEVARPLLREAILIGAREKVGRDDASSRMALVETALQDLRAAVDKLPPSPPSPNNYQAQGAHERLLDAASRMESAYNRTEKDTLDNMQQQNTTLHASSAFLRSEMARLNALLADRITRLRRQQAWYSTQLYTARNSVNDANVTTAFDQLHRTFGRISAWLPEAQDRAPTVVEKAMPEVRVVEILLRDRQIAQAGQLAGWRVSVRRLVKEMQDLRGETMTGDVKSVVEEVEEELRRNGTGVI